MSKDVTRRQAVGRLVKLCGTAALTAGAYGGLYGRTPHAAEAQSPVGKHDFRVPGSPDRVVVARGEGDYGVESLVRKAVDGLGGMGRFVSRGDVVAVKPNMSWARPPQLAANTNPDVVAAVVKMCLEAGAAKVRLVDHTINDARRVFLTSGMEAAAKATGAELVYPSARLFKDMDLGGTRLGEWSVYTPVIEADRLINVPVAKHHGLTGLSLGMKNWIGAVGGSRGSLHQDIHQSIVDLARYFQPTLVVMDAVRIMLRNGPSGGRPSDVADRHTIIAGVDQVAVDAAVLPLFELFPEEIGYILLAEKQGLGKVDPGPGRLVKVTV